MSLPTPENGTPIRANPYDPDSLVAVMVRLYKLEGPASFLAAPTGFSAGVMAQLLRAYEQGGISELRREVVRQPLYGNSQVRDISGKFVNAGGPSVRFALLLFRGEVSNIFLPARKKDRLIFPVNPEEINLTQGRSSSTFDVVNWKQAIQIGIKSLRTLSFSSFFPEFYDPDYCHGMELDKSPSDSARWIWSTYNSDVPVRFGTVGSIVFPTMPVYVTNFTPSYRAGSPGDIFFDIELQEAVIPQVHKIANPGPASPPHPKHSRHRTRQAETLIQVAQAEYGKGNGKYWKDIAKANKFRENDFIKPRPPGANQNKIVQNPLGSYMLNQGKTLVIPELRAPR